MQEKVMMAASEPMDQMASSATFAIIPRKEIEREEKTGSMGDGRQKNQLLQLINVKELTKNRSLGWYQASNN